MNFDELIELFPLKILLRRFFEIFRMRMMWRLIQLEKSEKILGMCLLL
jgi:hypothetical protein